MHPIDVSVCVSVCVGDCVCVPDKNQYTFLARCGVVANTINRPFNATKLPIACKLAKRRCFCASCR